MSSVVTAACPGCQQPVSVEEIQAPFPVTCSKCQTDFIPAQVIAESNRKFEMMMYVGMLVIGLALVGYMAITNRMKPKGGEAPPPAPAATEPAPPASEPAPPK
ncbi:hypothetical protein Pan44_24930 [Caulifigura coniformis]|uniref:Uncharacterized protein n=1 Tax=Caulifigura coniformis TaxID=2527983 RepID=A0A517SEA1_9PLAN|nr:hypothetical protein [Caulifigura coniformis]QDT54460.1 hypothetical protein Pan44_24930 [Caulifigura coniformis]